MSGPLTPITSSHINSSPSRTGFRRLKDINDLSALKSSSVDHFRNLADSAADGSELTIPGVTSEAEDVAGLQGRIRLQKTRDAETTTSMSRNWMDKQRKALQAYEYLCHIGEAKEWIEACIGERIPVVVELEEALRDGVILAQLAKVFAPHLVRKIFRAPKLQWLHSNNIQIIFKFLDEVEMPELFRFEFTDLYDKKNIPKVIYCIHALSYILSSNGLAPEIGDLVGKLEFTDDEIRDTQRGLDAAGLSLPNFKAVIRHFDDSDIPNSRGVTSSFRVSQESEEERVDDELTNSVGSIILLQSAIRGAVKRSVLRSFSEDLEGFEQFIVDLQTHIRGRCTRNICGPLFARQEQNAFAKALQAYVRRYLVQERLAQRLDDIGDQIFLVDVQSGIRGTAVRKQIEAANCLLNREQHSIVKLQSFSRRFLFNARKKIDTAAITNMETNISDLQACVRGCLLRRRLDTTMIDLHNDNTIVCVRELQGIIRGSTYRRKSDRAKAELQLAIPLLDDLRARIRGSLLRVTITADHFGLIEFGERMPLLQSYIRGMLTRGNIYQLIANMQESLDELVLLQSECRGALVRDRVNAQHDLLSECVNNILILQSHIRGVRGRFQYYYDLRSVDETEDIIVIPLQSLIRGSLVRDQYFALIGRLSKHTNATAELQSLIRGALLRVDFRTFQCDLEAESRSVLELQTLTRGAMVRRKYNERRKHFEHNMGQVIKIQSIIRAKQQSRAYKALTSGKNPPLATVKNFIHLLTDSDLDFEEEVEFEKLRKQVVDEVHRNEQLEQFIDQLDVKIALLLKNKITLDEVIKHQHRAMPKSWSGSTNDPFDLRSLNKTSRRRLELYQGLFFVLQTQPAYLCRLFNGIKEIRVTEMDMKSVESCIMSLLGYAQNRREEFYLLKLIAQSICETLELTDSIQEFVKSNYMWTRLLSSYTRGTTERQYLCELVGPLVKSIIKEEDMDLESDPLTIYHASINNEELMTGKRSTRDHNVVVDVAIRDPETRAIYIKNLQCLRGFVVQFIKKLSQNVDTMPYGIRYLGRELFTGLQKSFPSETEDRLLSAIGNVLYYRYMNAAIIAPDMVGIHNHPLTQLQKKNLSQLGRIITQVSTGKLFTEEYVFLQPLNVNLTAYITDMRDTVREIIQVPDPEIYFDLDEFDDLTATKRPSLYLKMTDIHFLHSILIKYLEFMAPDQSDPLRDAVKELGPLPSNSNEILNISRLTEVKLDLNPGFIRVEDPESEVNSLMVEAKRCLLYVIRVQTGSNLLEILIKQVTDEDERKYSALLAEERESKSGTTSYSSDNSLGDLSRLSYRDLKVIALEKVIELETLGKITRKNYFQDLLNSIATDIRTKRNRRVRRQKELESVTQTLGHLAQKEQYLRTQLRSYNDYIEQAMSTLQAKKGKRKVILPFTKQYFHMRELQKTGRVPKFGSFKYSASKLFEKSVLTELVGFGDKQYDKINFTISSDQVGIFFVEASQGSIALPAGSVELTLDELLDKQYNNQQYLKLFDDMAIFNTNLLLHLIFKKFYRDG
ncbi:hypothetical protein V1520DRAFT_377879 [Lipomyces starkeyi]|uniref:Ras-GAP domain-containing protein n=1 Tax=Lipomyces starkeyi NRRL Y-11557 TaxID=675824 RepID=A0A1E3PYN5_LIPST|nr:hypothetical protein LIPSTDRAFT_5979 [Lipomyces starkeyi NRRL Y-11557]